MYDVNAIRKDFPILEHVIYLDNAATSQTPKPAVEAINEYFFAYAGNYGRGDSAAKPEYNYVREVDYCTGACLLVRKDLFDKLNGFLKLNDRDILNSAGRISHEMAKQFAESEYDKFNTKRIEWKDRQDSDFDKTVKMIEEEKKRKKTRLKGSTEDKKTGD